MGYLSPPAPIVIYEKKSAPTRPLNAKLAEVKPLLPPEGGGKRRRRIKQPTDPGST
jgi:hypothetical protein